jgi:type I restriction enzyme R subunit
MSAEQKALVDLILAIEPDSMTDTERLRLASMTAAYVGVQFTEVHVVSITWANSSRVRLELPASAKERLLSGFRERDPRLFQFFSELGGPDTLLRMEEAAFSAAIVPCSRSQCLRRMS